MPLLDPRLRRNLAEELLRRAHGATERRDPRGAQHLEPAVRDAISTAREILEQATPLPASPT